MELDKTHLTEYLQSGEYFQDAKKWYNQKYITPFSERTYLLFLCGFVMILFCTLLLNINSLLPVITPVQYTLYSSSYDNSVNIIKADQIKNNPLLSIADIMIRNYITKREIYNYKNLNNQFLYVQNNSTRIVFKQFSDYMSIDNPISPVLRYQQSVKRDINIIQTSYPTLGTAIVQFNSIGRTSSGEIFENINWNAQVNFDIDNIDVKEKDGMKYNFVITNYKLALIQDNLKK